MPLFLGDIVEYPSAANDRDKSSPSEGLQERSPLGTVSRRRCHVLRGQNISLHFPRNGIHTEVEEAACSFARTMVDERGRESSWFRTTALEPANVLERTTNACVNTMGRIPGYPDHRDVPCPRANRIMRVGKVERERLKNFLTNQVKKKIDGDAIEVRGNTFPLMSSASKWLKFTSPLYTHDKF